MKEALAALRGRRALVALTGAGISVPSGIPDFRSADGLWSRFDPMDYATIDAFLEDPDEVWRMLHELIRTCDEAEPNPAHVALAGLEGRGVLRGVVTQNMDGLHQRAGSRRVVAYHGDHSTWTCLRCPWRGASDGPLPARCPRCEALLKPDVVFFGEPIPAQALVDSAQLLDEADGVLLVGTSGEVWPFIGLAYAAARRGLPILEFNLVETDLALELAAVTVLGDVSQTLPAFVAALMDGLE